MKPSETIEKKLKGWYCPKCKDKPDYFTLIGETNIGNDKGVYFGCDNCKQDMSLKEIANYNKKPVGVLLMNYIREKCKK